MSMNVVSRDAARVTAAENDDARQRLHGWHAAGATLSFVYARSLGGLVQSGRGHIATLLHTALTIDAGGSLLFVVLSNAKFDDTPQIFFTPQLTHHFQVAGIGISLGNHDWLFFSDETIPKAAQLALGSGQSG